MWIIDRFIYRPVPSSRSVYTVSNVSRSPWRRLPYSAHVLQPGPTASLESYEKIFSHCIFDAIWRPQIKIPLTGYNAGQTEFSFPQLYSKFFHPNCGLIRSQIYYESLNWKVAIGESLGWTWGWKSRQTTLVITSPLGLIPSADTVLGSMRTGYDVIVIGPEKTVTCI